ncbi:MAG: response regulator, partial [Candidatus Sulfotelmatobacter sp.]
MTLSSLLVCSDKACVEVLRQVLEELSIQVELCTDNVRAAVRLAQERYDLIILDCETQAGVLALLHESRSSRLNDSTLTVVVVAGQESIREMFSLGVNFVLYKPVSHERALSTLRAAQTVLHRDKRRKARAAVHTQATIDYAGEERAKATLVNLAEDGMGVNFGKKLPPTCKVYFQFQLPGQMKNVRLSGQVVWQDWNGRAGIQFVDVPQASRRVLEEWLKMNVAEAPEPAAEAETVEPSIRPNEDSVAAEQQVERHEAQG